MPRIRTVKPEFWSHPVMGRQKDDVKTMAIALLNLADDEGYFYADPATIRSFARPFEDDSKITLGCLQRLLKIEYLEVRQHKTRGFIGRITGFLDHQRVDKPKPSVIKKFHDQAVPVIVLGLIQEPFENLPAGKEGNGKEEVQKPSARKTRGAEVNNSQVSKTAAETRHSRLMEATKQWFKEWAGTDCPWDGGEGRQLSALLSAWPGGSDADFFRCLENIEKSDCIAPGTRPCKWLHDLLKFIKGPLDEFWKTKRNGNGNGTRPTSKANDREQRIVDRVLKYHTVPTGATDSQGTGSVAVPGNGGSGVSGLEREPEILPPRKDSGGIGSHHAPTAKD